MENPNSNMQRLFQTAGQKQTQQGTGYTNLNRVFQANQGNKLGEKVVGGISTQLGGAKSALQQEQDKFKEQAEANRLDTDANKAERAAVLGRFTNASSAGGDVAEEDVNKFQQFRSGEYKGPSGLGDISGIQQTASGIAQQTSNFSPSGTKELLRRSVGGNRYTQGQTKLDSLLLDRSALTPISRQAQGLTGEINRASLGAQGQAQTLAGQAKQFGQETNEQLNAGLSSLDAAAQEKLTAAQTAENQRLARIQAVQDFAAGKVAKKDAAGNIEKDMYGNTIYDTVNPRGTTDSFTQLNNLKTLLGQQGAREDEISQLFGSGNFADAQAQKQAALDKQNKLSQYSQFFAKAAASPNYYTENPLGFDMAEFGKYASADADTGASTYQNIKQAKQFADLLGNTSLSSSLESRLAALRNRIDQPLGAEDRRATESEVLEQFGGVGFDGMDLINQVNPKIAEYGQQAGNAFNSLGVAGQAAAAGKTEDFYKNLARSLANSQSAQGLTLQGTAGAPIRSNYTALQKLMGQGADLQKFKDTDEQYQAGNFLLNPDLIKRSL